MIIVLMGYMGSGKSTIGKRLAHILNFDFLDLDCYISKKEKSTITTLFNEKGEIYFRRKEAEYLKEILNSKTNLVLALGGGTPCYGNNLKTLINNSNTKLIYLKVSISQLAERLLSEKDSRPLISHLKTKEEFIEFVGKHLFERNQYYNKAEFIVNSDFKSPKVVLENILCKLI